MNIPNAEAAVGTIKEQTPGKVVLTDNRAEDASWRSIRTLTVDPETPHPKRASVRG